MVDESRYQVWSDWRDEHGNGGSKPTAYICYGCGSLVVQRALHDAWHAKLGVSSEER